ncbi:MAG: ATP-binding protein [Opitutaceae bacterium]
MSLEVKIRRATGWLGLLTATIGLAVLIGWQLQVDALQFLPLHTGPMRPTAAACLTLAGAALWLRQRNAPRGAKLAAMAALALSVTGLAQRVFGFDLGLDTALSLGAQRWPNPGLSWHGGGGLVALSVALLGLHRQGSGARRPVSAWIANVVIGANAGALIGKELAQSTPATAWPIWLSSHLALALIVLGIGISLARPEDRQVRMLFSRSTEGILARRLLIAVALVPLGFGAIVAWLISHEYLLQADGAVLLVNAIVLAGFTIALSSVGAAVDIQESREESEQARLLLTARLQEQAAKLHETVAQRTQELSKANTSLRAVAESNALLAIVAQKTTNGVIITDPAGHIEWVNAAFTQVTGFNLTAIKGRKPGHFLQGVGTDPEAIAKLREAERNGQACNVEILNYTKNGEAFWQIVDMQPVRDPGGALTHFVAIQTHITARKHLEQQLRKSEELAREVGRLARIGGWEIDRATAQVTWSEATRRIHEVDDSFQPTMANVAQFFSGDARATMEAAISNLSATAPEFDVELPLLTARGRRAWVRMLGRGEFKAGKGVSVHGAIQDVTAERESRESRRQLELQLFQAQKMETLGTFAGGIAHDFNNLLTGIIGYHELAADMIAEDHPARACLSEALKASLRARELVEQILAFGRQSGGTEHDPIDMPAAIEEARRFLRATLPKNIAIEVECAEGSGRVLADATQIHQILLNLGGNAGHAMRQHGGTLRITLESVELNPDLALAIGKNAAPSYVRLSVSDTGHGMDEATRGRIFDPFFTTKNSREGTGLGLAVVHGIVRSHRGAITVESTVGSGSVFHVYLPAAGDRAITAEPATQVSPRGNGEFVCIVDDEEVVASCARLVLENKGYRTVTFKSAEACLAHLHTGPGDCALLVTDQTMPGMQGTELAQQVRQTSPSLPVVIMSGFFAKISPDELSRLGSVQLLSKPFTSDELAQAVHRALHPPDNAADEAMKSTHIG